FVIVMLVLAFMRVQKDRDALAWQDSMHQFQNEFVLAKVALAMPQPQPELISNGQKIAQRALNRFPTNEQSHQDERAILALLVGRAEQTYADWSIDESVKKQHRQSAIEWTQQSAQFTPGASVSASARAQLRRLTSDNDTNVDEGDDFLAGTALFETGHWAEARSRLETATS